ncbi:MAG: SRPBCC domain-containing protein [Candidatus Acidiferrales bacterium]
MNEVKSLGSRDNAPTRRQVIAGAAIAFGGLAAGAAVRGQASQPAMQEAPSTAANYPRTFLHQEVDFKASPQRIYEALLDSKQFAAFTGLSAAIDPSEGGAFSTFGGLIAGRNIELVPNQRIVQAWRPTHWDPGVYSIVKFELKPAASGTTIILDHTGFPEGDFDGLDSGWPVRYWKPLATFLAQQP